MILMSPTYYIQEMIFRESSLATNIKSSAKEEMHYSIGNIGNYGLKHCFRGACTMHHGQHMLLEARINAKG
jgi:hypothetical protein